MNKKLVFNTIGSLAILASVIMFVVGTNNSHLTELVDFFWVPLPLAVICYAIARKEQSKSIKNSDQDTKM